MSSAQEKAEVVLIIIKRLAKWVAIGGLGLLAIGAAIVFAIDYSDKAERKAQEALEAKVDVRAFPAKNKACGSEWTYEWEVMNNGDKVVKNVSVYVSITPTGFSKQINERYQRLESDKILKKGEGYGWCFNSKADEWPYERLTNKNVQITLTGKSVEFED